MKRSNRLVLLIGIFLALVAFVLVLFTLQNGSGPASGPEPSAQTTTTVVIAALDLPLGTKLTAESLTTETRPITERPADSYTSPADVIGQTVRQTVSKGQLITSTVINGDSGSITTLEVPAGYVAVSVLVDQTTGVGTLIKPGDHVDVVTGITTAERVPLVTDLNGDYIKVDDSLYNHTTVKVLAQGLQVLGTLLPPIQATGDPAASAAPDGGTSLTFQQQIVVLAATLQQAEVLKFAQMDGDISLVLRSMADCRNPDGTPAECPIIETTGITLRILVDKYGVVPPQVIQVVQPEPLKDVGVAGGPNR